MGQYTCKNGFPLLKLKLVKNNWENEFMQDIDQIKSCFIYNSSKNNSNSVHFIRFISLIFSHYISAVDWKFFIIRIQAYTWHRYVNDKWF